MEIQQTSPLPRSHVFYTGFFLRFGGTLYFYINRADIQYLCMYATRRVPLRGGPPPSGSNEDNTGIVYERLSLRLYRPEHGTIR